LDRPIKELESEITRILKIANGTLHMLLRVGFATNQPIRSLRLPSDKIIQF
jgi:hypothetical protein